MKYMGDQPSKESRSTYELTDLIFEPPLKEVSNMMLLNDTASNMVLLQKLQTQTKSTLRP
jgi:hypothetical protein